MCLLQILCILMHLKYTSMSKLKNSNKIVGHNTYFWTSFNCTKNLIECQFDCRSCLRSAGGCRLLLVFSAKLSWGWRQTWERCSTILGTEYNILSMCLSCGYNSVLKDSFEHDQTSSTCVGDGVRHSWLKCHLYTYGRYLSTHVRTHDKY